MTNPPCSEIRYVRRYRLLAPPPLHVAFPSISYTIRIEPVTGCPQWRLEAVGSGRSSAWMICQGGMMLEWLERELYHVGFDVMHPTVPSLILDRLCREGLAEQLGSHRKLTVLTDGL